MEHHGVRRYVGVTSGGTSEASQPGSGLVFEWVFKRGIGRTHYADQRRQEQIVMASALRWTIARPARLASAPAARSYRVERGYVVPGEHTTARADLAEFLVPWRRRSGSSRAWPSSVLEHNVRPTPIASLSRARDLPSQPEWASAGVCPGSAAADAWPSGQSF
jgi:hypothetical protein